MRVNCLFIRLAKEVHSDLWRSDLSIRCYYDIIRGYRISRREESEHCFKSPSFIKGEYGSAATNSRSCGRRRPIGKPSPRWQTGSSPPWRRASRSARRAFTSTGGAFFMSAINLSNEFCGLLILLNALIRSAEMCVFRGASEICD